jgi:hypothetical protein
MTADNENKLVMQQNRGAAADVELRVVGGSFKELREQYVKAWEGSDARDTAGREKLWVAMTIISQVEAMLRTHVVNGKVAERELDAIRKAGEPKAEKPIQLREFRRS